MTPMARDGAAREDATLRSRRREALRRHPTAIGLDYVEVAPGVKTPTLRLHFVPPAPGVEKDPVPTGVRPEQLRIVGSLSQEPLPVARLRRAAPAVLAVYLSRRDVETATSPRYTLTLVDLPQVDPFFTSASFSFEVDAPRPFDCTGPDPPRTEALPVPEIDYLARDYAGFRRLMLDRLSLLMPDWRPSPPVDWPVAVVEAVAAVADQLSYYQDAVATEAYVGSARRRTSVRRHARLLDYRMHDGCTARAWVAFAVDQPVTLAAGTQLVTRLDGRPPCIKPEDSARARALAGGVETFELLDPAELHPAHEELRFYTWGARELWLPEGATAATLVDDGRLSIEVGDVLIFEEKRSPATGLEADADPEHRHAVRLARVKRSRDPLGGRLLGLPREGPVDVLEIEWHARDALPFPLCAASAHPDVAVARGNVVLAVHGRTIEDEAAELEEAPGGGVDGLRLRHRGLAHSVPYDAAGARARPAADAVEQEPRSALPELGLREQESGELWSPRRDLLESDRFARDFVVEMEEDGSARLRFGDGVRGRRPSPGTGFLARYRVGNGTAGNVGRAAIAHLVAPEGIADGVVAVGNPLAGRGGVDPEPIERVRLDAPWAFRTPERCITEADYAALVDRHPEVGRGAVVSRRLASWPVMVVAVERGDGRPVTAAFAEEVRAFLNRFRLAGTELQVRGPSYLPIEVALTLHVGAEYLRSTVQQELVETFGHAETADGRRGFFHRAHFGFGEPIYLSRVIAAAMAVPGVARVDATTFQRVEEPTGEQLREGYVGVGPLEMIRLDNHPHAPEHGTFTMTMKGGR